MSIKTLAGFTPIIATVMGKSLPLLQREKDGAIVDSLGGSVTERVKLALGELEGKVSSLDKKLAGLKAGIQVLKGMEAMMPGIESKDPSRNSDALSAKLKELQGTRDQMSAGVQTLTVLAEHAAAFDGETKTLKEEILENGKQVEDLIKRVFGESSPMLQAFREGKSPAQALDEIFGESEGCGTCPGCLAEAAASNEQAEVNVGGKPTQVPQELQNKAVEKLREMFGPGVEIKVVDSPEAMEQMFKDAGDKEVYTSGPIPLSRILGGGRN